MVGKRTRLGFAALLAGALLACGRAPSEGGPAAEAPTEAPSAAEIAAGPCGGGPPLAQLACGAETLTAAAQKLEARYAEEAAALSPDAKRVLEAGLADWIAAQRVLCGAPGDGPPGADTAACLAAALNERLAKSDALVQERGGFAFLRVESLEAEPVPAAIAQTMGEGAPTAVLRSVAAPRIDNPRRLAPIQRFNEAMAQKPAPAGDAPVERTTDYVIAYASAELVSVKFETYEMMLGAAHPNASMRAVNVLMRTGAPLGPADIFTAGSGWEAFLTDRAMTELSRAFEEFGAGPPEVADVRDTAVKAHNWVITEGGLTVLFPPYSIGPHALGAQEVTITWSDLRPYLNASAPAPIGQG